MDTMISEQDLADQSRALLRLKEEYMQWRIDHPFGFYARPAVVHEIPFPYSGQYPLAPFELGGATHFHNLCSWHCGIPGKSNVR